MRLTTDEIDDIWSGLSIGEDEIDMHEYAEAIEAAVLAKLADKLLDADRYACMKTFEPDMAEQLDEELDAALLASMAVKP